VTLEFHGGSLIILILFLDICTMCKWDELQMFQKYILPPAPHTPDDGGSMYLLNNDNTIHFHATAGSTSTEYISVNRNNCYYIKGKMVHPISAVTQTIFHYEYFHHSISYSPTGLQGNLTH
jgi:hypothetical protein